MLRIALAQLDPVVGAFESNIKKIKEAYQRACSQQARLLLTPELAVCGYPPQDLMDRPEMFERNERAVQELQSLTRGQSCALAVGHVAANPSSIGRPGQNAVTVLENGKTVFTQAKTLLPSYDVFDEARYFEPAHEVKFWNCDGFKVGIAICEDLWAQDSVLGRRLYARDPVQSYAEHGIHLLLSLSSSPYEWGKRERRERLHQEVARRLKVPLVYVNQVGATDELLFDGGSFALDSEGKLLGRLPLFEPSWGIVSGLISSQCQFESSDITEWEEQSPKELEVLSRGLILGIREYFKRTGFHKAILGLSGGIDSALVATLAVQALGKKNVLGIAMPSQYSSSHSLEDAEKLAINLGISLEVRPIKFLFSTALREISERRGELAPLAAENLQARLRGIILMSLSNHDSSLVLTTGNKSELAMGYCTMYGDMAGALAPIGDLYKTQVYELASYINLTSASPIPERSITRPPSAELSLGQTDQDSLPPYEILDELLFEYIEKGTPVLDLESRFKGKDLGKFGSIREVLRCLELNEYKRRQAAPVLKVSQRAFGMGRRIPIAKRWDG